MLLLIILFVSVCSIEASEISPMAELSKGFYNFSVDLYEQCNQVERENFMVSPFAVTMALSLLSQVTNGNSFEEIKKALNLKMDKAAIGNQFQDYFKLIQESAGEVNITVANQIYVQKDYQLQKNIQLLASEKFFSGIESVDFTKANDTAETINNLVKNKTFGKISEIVQPDEFDNRTRVVLVNTIHFKSFWKTPFSKESTSPWYFVNHTRRNVTRNITSTVFMKTKGYFSRVRVGELMNANALMMDYRNSNLSMIIIEQTFGDHLDKDRLKKIDFSKIVSRMTVCDCVVWVPTFTLQTEFHLNDILKKMGIREIFTDKADLSGLSNSNEKLVVTDIIHKIHIDVNDEHDGPVKEQNINLRHVRNRAQFVALRPASYFVWDKSTNTTIFNGKITDFPMADLVPLGHNRLPNQPATTTSSGQT